MELRVAEGKAFPKREFQSSRSGRNHRSLMRNNLLESIAQVNGGSVNVSRGDEDGVVRMKLVVRKQDLKQMMELIRGGKSSTSHHQQPYSSSSSSSSLSLEQRLNLLRKKHLLRGNMLKGWRQHSWTPALQSIPEELQA